MLTSRSQVNKRFISAIVSLDDREINPNVIDVARDGSFADFMVIAKRYKVTKEPFYEHFENEDVSQVLTFDTGGVTGSGTATLTVTITTTGYARRGQQFLFANGKVGMINSAITTASNKDSFTITSVDGTNLTAVAGDKIAPLAIVVGEKASFTTDLAHGLVKYSNQYGTFADSISLSDVQINSAVTIGGGYYQSYLNLEQAKRFKLAMSGILISGVKSVNQYGTASPTLVDENGNSVQTTNGVYTETVAYGVNDQVTTLGTPVMADLDDLLDQLLAVKAPKDYMLLSPDRAWRKYDDLLKNLGSSGVTSARLNMDGVDVNYNVQQLTKGSFNLKFTPFNLADHPQMFNFTGSSAIGKTIMGIPESGKVKVQATGGSGSEEPYVQIRYAPNPVAAQNRGSEYIQETWSGALAPVPNGTVNEWRTSFYARQGVEVNAAKHLFNHRVLS